nr:MAG TPA: hypothetical protein [Caudoviricetes sp.]
MVRSNASGWPSELFGTGSRVILGAISFRKSRASSRFFALIYHLLVWLVECRFGFPAEQ